MGKILRTIGLGLLALVLILVVAVAVLLPGQIKASFPQTDGEIQISGLDGPVDVYRDEYGIPHIYASTEHDLFFAQGYVHAQDRFWQMDFQRHTSTGRLSELLGSNTVDIDKFLRTMGWERVARAELELMDDTSMMMLEAYAAGVNAYLAEHNGTEISLEYLFLKLLNSGYTPAPWEPLHTVSWAKAMAWDLRDNMDIEIERSLMLKTLSLEQIAELYPAYPADMPVIVPDFELADEPVIIQNNDGLQGEQLADLMQVLDSRVTALDNLLNSDPNADLGSNSWVVSGDLTASGMPLFANDPHLGASVPSIWYQMGLHCEPVGPDCNFNAAGVTFVGAPGIVLGHNDSIAWGFTNVGPDVMDLFVIKVNPSDPYQYELNGEWVDMEVIVEEIVVAGGETIEMPVRITKFGPIVSDTYGSLSDFDENSGLNLPDNYAVALKWTALEPGTTLQSLFQLNRAQNFEEFRAAASQFVVPSQNLLYADVEGNIGYQMPGYIPLRAAGDGLYPAPGWTDQYDWQGYIPFDQLPYSYNPESGYIVTANNAVVGEEYPYRIADVWDYGFRAQRIVEMIENAPGPIDIAYYQEMLGDNMNLGAVPVVEALVALDYGDARLNELRDLLASWNGAHDKESNGAALFAPVWKHLLANTFNDNLPESAWPNAGGGSGWYVVVENLLAQPDSAWWDDTATPEVETRDDILKRSFADGVAEVEDKLGKDESQWAWGDLHTITYEHDVMSNFPLIDKLFNPGPYRLSGGNSIVNATGWGGSEDYNTSTLPSKRTIFDLGNWQNALQITTVGQSGHANHPNYNDLAPLWANIEFIPLYWDREAIEAAAAGHLILKP
ncbi:MAG TPA: penicillin acylase family protein [Anaerolineales bacterium]|nr:penicillin acylase family protein [Anaerolineales bacterium]HRQ92674.1 penicillin acylase family protein [Anaerolineales bacterium]